MGLYFVAIVRPGGVVCGLDYFRRQGCIAARWKLSDCSSVPRYLGSCLAGRLGSYSRVWGGSREGEAVHADPHGYCATSLPYWKAVAENESVNEFVHL
ncbi:hypothetical protein RSAG8_04801, partial [Rhizoctonia solani AG-8 WAC10335]